MNGLLVCATKPEWSELKKLIHFHKSSELPSLYSATEYPVYLLQTGIGPSAAQNQIKTYLQEHQPQWILHFGLSGALDPTLQVGDCLLATELIEETNKISCDQSFNELMHTQNPTVTFQIGRHYSSTRVLATPDTKNQVWERHHTLSVDMESYWIAQIARQKEVPYYYLRAIFDTASEDLSILANTDSIAANGDINSIGLASSLIRKPSLIMSLPRYQKMASVGNKALAQIISRFLKKA